MTGVPDEQIAMELNLGVAEVERLGREGLRIGLEIRSDPEYQAEVVRRTQQGRSHVDRPTSARQLLRSGSFLSVERAASALGPSAPDLYVSFDDIAAHDFDDLVDETVLLLRQRADVQAADRED